MLLEKHTTTYKQVSDYITSNEAQRLALAEASGNGPYGQVVLAAQKDEKVDHN